MANVRDFGAAGDGLQDDTEALRHAIDAGDGVLELPRGDYLICQTLEIPLAQVGRFALHGSGGTARLLMAGPGPALWLRGTHDRSADPASFQPGVWQDQRLPTIANLEIVGRHPEADGVRLEGVMQPTLSQVLIRQVRHGIHVTGRARNLLIGQCHVYHNTGVGIFLERVNLHQAIVTGSHISYCRQGGLRITDSEIRNLQITGNDIEYNNNRAFQVANADAEPTAEIYIECQSGSIREGTIASNTLQATYSPNGANIRLVGAGPDKPHKVGLFAISGNLIGSQEVNIHCTSVRGVTIAGNVLYSGHSRNLLLEQCRNLSVGANVFDHNPDYEPRQLCTGIRLVDCVDSVLSGLVIQDGETGRHTVPDAGPQERQALVELVRCRRIALQGVQILDGTPLGLAVEDSHDVTVTGCGILDTRAEPRMQRAIDWRGEGTGNLIANCRLGGPQPAIAAPPHVRRWNNLEG
jgi:hypothetical protein